MNGDFEGPRISPAEFLSERPERNQRAAGPAWFRTSCYSSRVFECRRHPWHFDWQLYEASGGDRRYSSMNRGGAFRHRVSNGGVSGLGHKSMKKRKEGNEGQEGEEGIKK